MKSFRLNMTGAALVAVVGAFGLLAPEVGCSSKAYPAAPMPKITSFTVSHPTTAGAPTTQLTAVYSGGGGSLNHKDASGTTNTIYSGIPFTVSQTEATTYTLVVTNSDGKTVSATVLADAINLTSSVSTVTSGGTTQLTATFAQGTGTIDHGVGVVTSGVPVTVSPRVGTDYTLTVSGDGTDSASVSTAITVNAHVTSLVDLSLTPGLTVVAPSASPWTTPARIADPANDSPVNRNSFTGDNLVYGSWPNITEEEVEYQFPAAVTIDHSAVYWATDDDPTATLADNNGGIGVPSSYKIQYWDSATSAWVDVPNAQTDLYDSANSWWHSLPPSGTPSLYYRTYDEYDYAAFSPVTTTGIRLLMEPRSQTGANGGAYARSLGIIRWKVFQTTY